MGAISRRQFLRAVVPPRSLGRSIWRVVLIGLIVGAGLYVAITLVQVARQQGVVASAKAVGFLGGICAVVLLLSQLTQRLERALAAASDEVRAFVAKLNRLAEFATALWLGALLHARWSEGKEIVSMIVGLGIVTYFWSSRDEKKP